jgi:glycosyltransferase involved in cell wall biosynthesis
VDAEDGIDVEHRRTRVHASDTVTIEKAPRAMGSKPKVLIVTGEYPPMLGGIGDYTCKLSDALLASCVEPLLFVPAGSRPHNNHVPIAATYDHWSWSTLPLLHKTLEETEADWLHVQHQVSMYKSHLSAYAIPRYLRRKRWGGRVAVTFHDLNPPVLFSKGTRLWWWFSRDWILADLARHAHVALAADPAHVEQLAQFGADARQVPIGSNIAASTAHADSAVRVRRLYGIPEETFTIGHFGTPIGLETLLDALGKLPNSLLLLIGKQQSLANKSNIEKLTGRLMTVIDTLGIDDRLRWTGHLPEQDAAAALAACDVIVLPYESGASLRHGGLMAAINQGKAVITSNPLRPLPGLADGEAILTFQRGDATDLAAAIEKVAAHPQLRKTLENNAAIAARDIFSWESIARSHRQIYVNST